MATESGPNPAPPTQALIVDSKATSRSILVGQLREYGVTRIYSPEDGQGMGLQGMINEVVQHADYDVAEQGVPTAEQALSGLKAGDKVRFVVQKSDTGFVVTDIQAAK